MKELNGENGENEKSADRVREIRGGNLLNPLQTPRFTHLL